MPRELMLGDKVDDWGNNLCLKHLLHIPKPPSPCDGFSSLLAYWDLESPWICLCFLKGLTE